MQITQEGLEKFYELARELDQATELASEVLRTVQDQYRECKATITRGGKEITVTEKDLWDEIYHLGEEAREAREYLEKKYPDVFSTAKKQNELAQSFNVFCMAQLGFNPFQPKAWDIVKLIDNLVDLAIKRQKNA